MTAFVLFVAAVVFPIVLKCVVETPSGRRAWLQSLKFWRRG